MVQAQTEQNAELQSMQQRLNQAYGLEDTVKRQNMIIERLEGLVHKLVSEQKGKLALYHLRH